MQALNGPWEQEAWRPRIDIPEGTTTALSFLTSRGRFIPEVESFSDYIDGLLLQGVVHLSHQVTSCGYRANTASGAPRFAGVTVRLTRHAAECS